MKLMKLNLACIVTLPVLVSSWVMLPSYVLSNSRKNGDIRQISKQIITTEVREILSHSFYPFYPTKLYSGIEEGGMDIDMVRETMRPWKWEKGHEKGGNGGLMHVKVSRWLDSLPTRIHFQLFTSNDSLPMIHFQLIYLEEFTILENRFQELAMFVQPPSPQPLVPSATISSARNVPSPKFI
jgi:hypothetical protein